MRLNVLFYCLAICTCNLIAASIYADTAHQAPIKALPLEVIGVLKHDNNAYTQGLFYDGDILFESSGLYGRSFIRRHDKEGSATTQGISPHLFAEGLTVIDDTLYLLTWKAGILLSFDKNTLQPKQSLRYKGQGWGLTHNDAHFIMSNGSNKLTFRNRKTFAIEKTLVVPDIDDINELEYIDGIIWANRWYNDNIYAISEDTGCIIGTLDVSSLRRQAVSFFGDNVTNGIAYNKAQNALLITGKRWNKQFFVRLPNLPKSSVSNCH